MKKIFKRGMSGLLAVLMQKRNRHLVDNSSACICYLTKPTGGTAYTVNYASEHGLMIINIAQQLL